MNSRSKGKRGELEFSKYIVERFKGTTIDGEPVACRRGQQFRGGIDQPDVITNVPLHFEVKRTERLRVYDAVEQAVRDGGDKAVVAYKANHKPWLAILPMDAFLDLLADRISEDKEK
jgi:hypothetical protein